MMKHYVRLACFVGGALFGSAGIKLLTSKDAKKAYTHITAAGLRMKDSVMETVTTVQENAADILDRCQGHQRGPGRQGSRGSGGRSGSLKTAEGSRKTAPFFMKGDLHESNHRTREPGPDASAAPAKKT